MGNGDSARFAKGQRVYEADIDGSPDKTVAGTVVRVTEGELYAIRWDNNRAEECPEPKYIAGDLCEMSASDEVREVDDARRLIADRLQKFELPNKPRYIRVFRGGLPGGG